VSEHGGSAAPASPASDRSRRHWVVFGAAFAILLGAAGTRSAAGVLVDPLREEFGWGRGTVGLAVSIDVLLFGFIGPFAAALQQLYGLRRVTTTALVIIAVGAALTTRMSQPWHLYLLWGAVVGIGSGCMATVFASTVASRWFVARRGLGLDWVATVPPTVALCIAHFGRDRGPLVYGWVFTGHQVGAAVAAWGAGALHDVTGSYRSAFVLAGVFCLLASAGVMRIDPRQPQFEPGAGTSEPVGSRS
jgi:cyanate permease